MPRFIARPFEVSAEQWWPDGVVAGVYRVDRHAPKGVPASQNFSQDECGWTFARGRIELVEPGDMVVDTVDGRFICKPESFERLFVPAGEAAELETV